ncbi:MAG: lytic transglycosylase domain-containing protein [Alphaproteobacteria bacterium]|nr:lytic transglycosylase domain-containing protein [Alphaproteobacteria bacterium]
MKLRIRNNRTGLDLPLLAALILLFTAFNTGASLDAAPATLPLRNVAELAALTHSSLPAVLTDSDGIEVLSARDAALYRMAFAAQKKGDDAAADDFLGQIKDKKLFGHVLADRYLRRKPTLDEARMWMALYASLPEAPGIYNRASRLPGFAKAKIARPVNAGSGWNGGSGEGMSRGFHADAENQTRTRNTIAAALHRGAPTAAHAILISETKRGHVPAAERNAMVAHIAAAYYYEGENDRARPMAHEAAEAGVPLGLWIDGLSAWKERDYAFATRSFASLAQAPGLSSWDHAAASYWAYRAAARSNDKIQAQHWLAEAAKYPRSFYGYLASVQSGQMPRRSWAMPDLTTHDVALLEQYPAGWQALALTQIGQTDSAERELRRLASSQGSQNGRALQAAALALAEKGHMASLVMQLGGSATDAQGHVYEAAAYPVPVWQPTSGFTVDRALMFALIKHESQFDPTAVSPRGACGLMQLMPATASRIDETNDYRTCSDHLADPAVNMELGQRYVRLLAGQPMIGDNLLLLLAAYNGGPGNLAHWMEGGGMEGSDASDPLLFIESLPVSETRNYVQQVLLQYWMYRSRLNEPETSVAQLAHGQWPRYALGTAAVRQAAATPLTVASR